VAVDETTLKTSETMELLYHPSFYMQVFHAIFKDVGDGGRGHLLFLSQKMGKIFFRANIMYNQGILLMLHTYILVGKCLAAQS